MSRRRVRVFQVITRTVRGGAWGVVEHLLDRLPPEEFEQTLLCGGEPARSEAVRIPELVREIRPVLDLRAALRLGGLLSRRRPDVVHAHTYKAGVLASVAARIAGTAAVIFSPHGHIFSPGAEIPGVPGNPLKRSMLRWVTRAAQTCAHRVTALSDVDLRDQVALRLAPRSRYVVVRNGIDLDRFAARAGRVPVNGDGPVVGAVGRFTSEKGHDLLLDALVRVRGRLPRARLVLVGYGELEGELRGRAERLGVSDAVTFAGERDAEEVLPEFDIFVQPSRYESQGVAILEAMAAGRPVVATDVGGVRDVVRDGETGLLVRPGEADALSDAIVRLAETPDLARSLAERARTRVREGFSVDQMVRAYARLYRDLLGRYNPGPTCSIT